MVLCLGINPLRCIIMRFEQIAKNGKENRLREGNSYNENTGQQT